MSEQLEQAPVDSKVSSDERIDILDPLTGEAMEDIDGLGVEALGQRTSDAITENISGFDEVLDEPIEDVLSSEEDTRVHTSKLKHALSDLGVLFIGEERQQKFDERIAKLAAEKGVEPSEFIGEHFKVVLPIGKDENGVVQREAYTPTSTEDYFRALRLSAYASMNSGNDILMHGTYHTEKIVSSGVVLPKTRQQEGEISISTGLHGQRGAGGEADDGSRLTSGWIEENLPKEMRNELSRGEH